MADAIDGMGRHRLVVALGHSTTNKRRGVSLSLSLLIKKENEPGFGNRVIEYNLLAVFTLTSPHRSHTPRSHQPSRPPPHTLSAAPVPPPPTSPPRFHGSPHPDWWSKTFARRGPWRHLWSPLTRRKPTTPRDNKHCLPLALGCRTAPCVATPVSDVRPRIAVRGQGAGGVVLRRSRRADVMDAVWLGGGLVPVNHQT